MVAGEGQHEGSADAEVLAELGGVDGVLALDPAEPDPALDVVVAALLADWPEQRSDDAVSWLCAALEHCDDPLRFEQVVERLTADPILWQEVADPLAAALLVRAHPASDPRTAYMATVALEAATALALTEHGAARRLDLALIVRDAPADADAVWALSAARMAGLLYAHWSEPSLRMALAQGLAALEGHPAAMGDAMVERGHVAVVEALEAEQPDQLWRQLEVAERRFGEAAETEDERIDATFMAAIIHALRSFGLGGPAGVAVSAAAEAREALRERGMYGRPEALPILSRRASEAAWMRLVDRLERLAPELDQPLWVRGAEVVNLLLEAIELSRAVRLAPGAELDVSAAVVPRIEAPLVRNLDQRRMLAHVLEREELPDKRRQAAAALLERVGEVPKGGGPEDPLEAVLGAEEAKRAAQMFDAGTLGRLRSAIFVRPARDAQWTERYDRILGDLDGSPDFASEFRFQIEALIADLLDFLSMCLRYELKFASGSLAYLGKPNAVEQQVADHLVMFLERNWTVHAEVRNEGGGGRVDVRVALGADRFIIECKRDQQPAAAGALDPYLAQADRYLATSLRIAGLAVLDLSDKKTGAVRGLDQSVWVVDMPPADPAAPTRKIISLIVPGNRPSTPSAVGKATARTAG